MQKDSVQEDAKEIIGNNIHQAQENDLTAGEDTKAGQKEKTSSGSAFEGIYDRLPDISVKAVDRFIILCVIALIAVILVGVLKANHIL